MQAPPQQGSAVGGLAWLGSDWARTAHQWQRYWAFACLLAAWTLVWWPVGVLGAMSRRERLAMAGTVVLCVLAINVLKHQSLTSCPVELAVFGGQAAQVSHWAWGALDGGYGKCFPSGHASGGFAFAAIAVFVWPHSPRWGRIVACMVIGQGLIFGGLQVVRGEHFVSHVLWCGAICLWLAVAARGLFYLALAKYPRVGAV